MLLFVSGGLALIISSSPEIPQRSAAAQLLLRFDDEGDVRHAATRRHFIIGGHGVENAVVVVVVVFLYAPIVVWSAIGVSSERDVGQGCRQVFGSGKSMVLRLR